MKSPPDLKRSLRSETRKRRDGLDPHWRKEASTLIARRAMGLAELAGVEIVSAYVHAGSEVETGTLILDLLRLKGCVALPRLHPDSGLLEHWLVRTLDETSWRSGLRSGLRPGPFGILEPDPDSGAERIEPPRIGVNFLPGLAFDAQGNRLGMGGGHYDRYLAASPHSHKFGLAFSSQILTAIPVIPTDIRMNGVITEKRVLYCSESRE